MIPTASITPKVKRYSGSLTRSEYCGGTKKKSNAATFRIAPKIAGPRPQRTAARITARKYTMTRFAGSK